MRWTGISRLVGRRRARPSASLGKWLEALLLVVLLVQVARALWSLVTPVGLFGDWRPRQPVLVGADARRALFAGFDPFFRTGGGSGEAVQQVTSLALQLFGTRINESSGLGSAIIAGADGVQQSYAVGDEIMPGVILKAVAFDHVVIDRGGATETLFIDQSTPVAPSGDGGSGGAVPPPTPGPGLPPPPAVGGLSASAADLAGSAMFSPRSEGGRTTGIVVSPSGAPGSLARTGLKAGDIITQVNGRAVSSPADINALQDQLRPGSRLSLMVERGSATVPVAIILEGGK